MVPAMDDLAFFERDRGRRRHPHRFEHDEDDRYYDRRRSKPERRGGSGYAKRRRAHPHIFAWLLLGGGAVLLASAVMVILSSLGIWGALASAYFAVTSAIMPETWRDEWRDLPGIAHVAMVLGALFLAAGTLGEIFD